MAQEIERVPSRHRIARAARATVAVAICGSVLAATPAWSQSITDRFKSLFGSSEKDQAPTVSNGPPVESQLTCPSVTVRSGASTYAVGLPGKEASGSDLRYQAVISRTARECNLNTGVITAKIGVQGRIIAGPAGAPTSVDVPLRVAVVQEGVSPKTVFTKAYRTSVSMQPDGSVPFSLVAEDVAYPAPSVSDNDAYVFYVGFDPQALKPEPKARKRK
ncbi:hypothetical protein [Rhodopseudomonas palustris]|uniref:Tat pathway signal sequence domain protein n=1 Tax=Rhodopseudomonas palustris (strain ATCC BAA-98 / CGA009) TaxID=258594 RepID=Q6NBI6_RHOPA|nr:hypothetical protein [Rhodopseudomonas palustris]OPF97504.1 hypothetical protein B1S06_00960 [Rhodopseudomonas palustris]PPQ41365.1 hypothetical protein CKO39_22305 [Rhodopseudomonas palustris]QQM02334.1 hypothetical protein I8G32_00860 [Rhodopseudomonas palustris]RJF59444.1 hypothetical protein D4Q71_24940 [Rhodopseudomonas palustris]WAB78531.1 hypothetical protein OR798_04340 [Rhodopseudomonas palustris]